MTHSPPPAGLRYALLLPLYLAMHTTLANGGNAFCGGAATPGDPSDLANVVGDQTLEYAAQQPASIVTCAKGYLLEKCGDHENAHKVFDKCIAAGYAGAMIWKALLLEDGAGVPRDPEAAARLMHRAATSGDPAYGPIGKMHYATLLLQGKGVARDEAAARRWFEAAAAEGNPEAQEFLRTGYHTGARDQTTLGAGTPPPGALVEGLTGDNASLPTVDRKKAPNSASASAAEFAAASPARHRMPVNARRDAPSPSAVPLRPLSESAAPTIAPPDAGALPPTSLPPAEPLQNSESRSRHLTPVVAQPIETPNTTWVGAMLALALIAGALLQGRRQGLPLRPRAVQPHYARG